MSDSEEEPYSTIFGSLKHPIRRKILRLLSEKPRSFSEMLEASEVSSSHLTYHLENLGQLLSKTDDGKYRLSKFGEAALATMSRIEETPRTTEPKHRSSLPLIWKSISVALLIGVVILAGISYTQYQSLNKLSGEYGQLVTTVTNPKQYILNSTFPSGNFTNPKLDILNSPYPNGTIVQTGVTETCWGGGFYSNGTAFAYGPIVIPCHVVEMTNGALVIVPDYDL
jgi:DNA-binding transcriptional ArsR family regulator